MEGLKDWPNMVTLSREEIFLYCDPKLLKLMLFMMTADSSSYTFAVSRKKDEKNSRGYEASNKEMLDSWMKRYRNEKMQLPADRDQKLKNLNFYDAIDE
jgi:hypothetical protein